MRINNNIMALNTQRKLLNNGHKVNRSLEKLSSGFKINKAGDNAAGLAISEKMRAQIRGLDQASQNSNDAISLIQTAEGALNETHSLIQRMRELSVHAANDVNSNFDRDVIQNEINQLTEEVNRIGNDTEFNTKKLLNRGLSTSDVADKELIITNLKKWWLDEAEQLVFDSYGMQTSGIDMDVVIFNDATHPAAALVSASYQQDLGNTVGTPGITGKGQNLSLEINLAYAQPVDGSLDGGSYPQYLSRVITHEITHAVMMTKTNFGDLPIWLNEGMAEFSHGADERLKNSIYLSGGGSVDPGNLDAGVAAVINKIGTGSYSDWDSNSDSYSCAYVAVRYLDAQIKASGTANSGTADSKGIKRVTEYLMAHSDENLDDALTALKTAGVIGFDSTAAWANALKTDVTSVASLETMAGVKLDFSVIGTQFTPEVDTGSVLGSDVTGNIGDAKTAESVLPQTGGDTVAEVEQPMSGFTITWPTGATATNDPFSIQIGANAGQNMAIEIADMRADAIGILEDGKGLKVNNHDAASKAIGIYDTAIDLVSSERSKLGAYENRLEHVNRNLETSFENAQSSESRIRDVDMAKEMLAFTKNNILQQASQAMLSQANQIPQGVLQLLN